MMITKNFTTFCFDFHRTKLLFCFMIIFCYGVTAQSNLLSPSTFPEDNFIINLVNQPQFSHCSVAVLQDKFGNGESADQILASTSPTGYKSAISIKFSANLPEDELPVKFHTTVKRFRKYSDLCTFVILMINDVRPEFVTQIFKTITPVYQPIFRKDEDFFIFRTLPQLQEQLLLMRELPARTKFKIAVGSEVGKTEVKVRSVCFFCLPGGNPKMIEFPVTSQNLPVESFDYFPDMILNLNGKLLHISFPNMLGRIESDPPWEGTKNAKRGMWKFVFEVYLNLKYNFTYHMFSATGKDGKYGGGGTGLQLDNGTWTGITGDLATGRADLGIVIANTPKRIYAIDYAAALMDYSWLTFVTGPPDRIYSPLALLWPFDGGMWAGIGFCTILSMFFFFFTFKIMKKFRFGAGEDWSISLQIMFLISTFLEQDSPVLPESSSLQCFVALWLFFTMIITCVYRSKMVTLLAFPVLGKLPQTFDELAFSGYKVGYVKHGDSAYNTMRASHDPVYVKLVAEMEIFHDYGVKCLQNTVEFKYGCIAYNFALIHLRERNMSEADARKLSYAPVKTYNINLGLGTEGKSIYRLNFDKCLRYVWPAGLIGVWDTMDYYYNVRLLKLQWWKETGQMQKALPAPDESDDLTMKHIAGAFYVLGVCLAVSLVAFLHELFRFYRMKIYYKMAFQYWATKRAVRQFKLIKRRRKVNNVNVQLNVLGKITKNVTTTVEVEKQG